MINILSIMFKDNFYASLPLNDSKLIDFSQYLVKVAFNSKAWPGFVWELRSN